MPSTRIRTTIIALVAAGSITAASMAPTVSQAAKNNGSYGRSGEAAKRKQQEQYCGEIHQLWNEVVGLEHEAAKEGNDDAEIEMLDLAGKTYELGKSQGCGWAARVQGSPSFGPRPSIGGAISG
jgi:hypothetical protein